MKLGKLTHRHLDMLAELCNIGAGHAATSLSSLMGDMSILLKVPRVTVVPLQKLPEVVGGPELFVGAVQLSIEGPLQGSMVTLFDEPSCRYLIGAQLKQKPSAVDFSAPLTISALAEIGNILASAFLGALSKMTRSRLLPSIPSSAFDMAGAVLDHILIEMGKIGDEVLFIEIQLEAQQEQFFGHLFIVPDPNTLENFQV